MATAVWPACCAIEMIATGTRGMTLRVTGPSFFRASLRQADLMIVQAVSNKMAPVIKRLYDQMSNRSGSLPWHLRQRRRAIQ